MAAIMLKWPPVKKSDTPALESHYAETSTLKRLPRYMAIWAYSASLGTSPLLRDFKPGSFSSFFLFLVLQPLPMDIAI